MTRSAANRGDAKARRYIAATAVAAGLCLVAGAFFGVMSGNWHTRQVKEERKERSKMTSIQTFVAAQNAAGRGANGITLDYDASGGTSIPGENAVIGFQSENLTGGTNAMLLDGPRSQYAISVDGSGNVTVTDTSSHQTVTDSGLSYILFNGAATATSNGVSSYPGAYFIESGSNVQLSSFYQAVLGRQPDLPGLEYWQHAYSSAVASGMAGSTALQNIAQNFINSTEFLTRFPSASAPSDQGGPNDTAFVTALYENVLGRAPDSGGLNYWVQAIHDAEVNNGLTGLQARTNILLAFTGSTENLDNINALNGGWLINENQGGYADATAQLPAATVLSQGTRDGYINTNLMSVTSTTNATSDGNSVTGPSVHPAVNFTEIMVSTANTTVVLSPTVTFAIIVGTNDTVTSAASGGSVINVNGSGITVNLSGSGNSVTAYSSNITVNGYVAGANTIIFESPGLAPVLLTAANGANLNFLAQTNYINLGALADGSAATFATAANRVYTVSDTNGTLPNAPIGGENIVFYAQVGANTVVWDWANAANLGLTADTNHNHQVDASELTQTVTLTGVQASSLTAHDFGAR